VPLGARARPLVDGSPPLVDVLFRTSGQGGTVDDMEWPRVTETVAVSAHRQVALVRWAAALAAAEASDPPVEPAAPAPLLSESPPASWQEAPQ
jgi:hypothetical protein